MFVCFLITTDRFYFPLWFLVLIKTPDSTLLDEVLFPDHLKSSLSFWKCQWHFKNSFYPSSKVYEILFLFTWSTHIYQFSSKFGSYSSESNKQAPCLHTAYSLVEKADKKQLTEVKGDGKRERAG